MGVGEIDYSGQCGLDAVDCFNELGELGVVVQDSGSYLNTQDAFSGCFCSKQTNFQA